jgi:phage protein D
MAVEELSVEEDLNLPSMFTIRLSSFDSTIGDWKGIDLDTFKPGDEIKIAMGLDETVDLLTGEITSLDLTFGDHCFLEIRGYDRLHRLRFGSKRRSFKDMKDSDIASKIAKEAGLKADVEDTGTVIPYLLQNNQSNYEFLLERAKRIGYELLVQDKSFIFRKSKEDKAPDLILEYGFDFDDLKIRLRTLTEGSTVEVRGWGVKDKSEITGTATDGSEKTTMAGSVSGFGLAKKSFGDSSIAVVDDVVQDAAEAGKLAEARYNTILKEFITGEGKTIGNPKIRAGKTIDIKKIGTKFSGTYYIAATTHSINDNGYMTTFKIKRTGI